MQFLKTLCSEWYLEKNLWNCPEFDANGLHWWSVNIGSGNGLMPSGNEALPEPIFTHYFAIWRHSATWSFDGLFVIILEVTGWRHSRGVAESILSCVKYGRLATVLPNYTCMMFIVKSDMSRTDKLETNSLISHIRWHYSDVIMGAMAPQITGVSIVYSTIRSGADQRKHQSSTPLAFVKGIHRWPVNSPHKGPVRRKMFPFDDVIMGAAYDPCESSQYKYPTRPIFTETRNYRNTI